PPYAGPRGRWCRSGPTGGRRRAEGPAWRHESGEYAPAARRMPRAIAPRGQVAALSHQAAALSVGGPQRIVYPWYRAASRMPPAITCIGRCAAPARPWRHGGGGRLTIIVKVTLEIVPGGIMRLANPAEVATADVVRGGAPL